MSLNFDGFRMHGPAESITRVSANVTDGRVNETVASPSVHDLQVYGIVVTILLCFIVFGGVKMINKVAPAFLVPVLFSLFCIFIGIFAAPRRGASRKFTLETIYYFLISNCVC